MGNELYTPLQKPQYRIGAVSQLTGIAVATLRVWQSRYAVVSPFKNEGGQRLYSDLEVSKLKMLKSLCHLGHSISSLSKMSLDQLQELLNGEKFKVQNPARLNTSSTPQVLCVIGQGLSARLEAIKFNVNMKLQAMEWGPTFTDLEAALNAPSGQWDWSQALVLLIKLDTLQMLGVERIQALQKRLPNAHIGVLYNYAQSQCLLALSRSGVQLKRDPLSHEELSSWIQELSSSPVPMPLAPEAQVAVQDQRFDQDALAYMMTLSTAIKCECPKHLAELLSQINAFAQYCQECLSQSPQDQMLHANLLLVAQSTRTMYENALETILEHEKITLPSPRVSASR